RNPLILVELLGFVRRDRTLEEQEFRSEQSGALGAVAHGCVRLGLGADIREYFDSRTVRGTAFPLCKELLRRASDTLLGELAAGKLEIRSGGVDVQPATLGVQHDWSARWNSQCSGPGRNECRNVHRRGDDCDVGGRTACGQTDAGESVAFQRYEL